MLSSAPLLTVNNICRRGSDRETWLLKNASMTLHSGERVGVTGPSGSGKTVLLRALALLDPVDDGSILWEGDAVRSEDIPKYRSRVMYLHQRPAFFNGHVESNLLQPFSLQMHRQQSFNRERVCSWLDELGREASFLNKSARDLSGGEAQLAALLRVLQLEPVVLLLDEPTAAMDQTTTELAEKMLLRWRRENAERAFIWISHDLGQIQRVADRFFLMESGKLVKETDEI